MIYSLISYFYGFHLNIEYQILIHQSIEITGITNMQKENCVPDETTSLALYRWIQQQTYKKFSQEFLIKYKKQYLTSDVYTVLCSIWIVDKSQPHFHSSKLISLANGTKTLPYSVYLQHKTQLLKDMHAQILVIKAFRKFVLDEIASGKSFYFIKDAKHNKFSFNYSQFNIILFSSEPFCGDCSINEGLNFFSGSKPLKYFENQKLPNQKFQKHVLRTKPGRTDLPQIKKSLSLSCSDKLALYNILGIQGKQLFNRVRPVYISCFIVETDTENKFVLQQGLNFQYRLAKVRNQSQELIKRKLFNIKIDQKQRQISTQFRQHKPNVVCIQKISSEQNSLIQAENLLKKRQKQGFEVSLIYTPDYLEWINNKTGLPEGCSLKNYIKQKKISKFSKQVFINKLSKTSQFSSVENGQKNNQTYSNGQTFKYSAIKDRIKLLFGIWTDHFKSKHYSSLLPN